MLAFIRDPCVTKAKWPHPVTVDALGMCNGTRDGLVLAPSVSTSSTVLCLQRGKVRLGCVSLLSFATSARTPLICPTRTLRTHSAYATAPRWLGVGTLCVDQQLNRPVPAAWQGSAWMRIAPFIRESTMFEQTCANRMGVRIRQRSQALLTRYYPLWLAIA